MQLPKLTPLQSRLLASAIATGLVVVIWIFFEPHHFVYAAEIPVPDHVQHSEFGEAIPLALADASSIESGEQISEERSDGVYAPDFAYFDRSLVGRQQDEVSKLTNNQNFSMEAAPGTIHHFRFESRARSVRTVPIDSPETPESENASERGTNEEAEDELDDNEEEDEAEGELKKRQAGRRVWISANTCRQPAPTVNLITESIPQLMLYVSSKDQKPGPNTPTGDLLTQPIAFVGGYASYLAQTDTDIYIGVSAPNLTPGWNGTWRYEVAASVDGSYHSYNNSNQFIFMVDTDSDSALFITHNLTTATNSPDIAIWEDMAKKDQLPLTMYTFPKGAWSPMMGLERSFCGLREQFNATNNISVATSITTKFGAGLPKGQFHIQGLKTGMEYTGFLAVGGSNQDIRLPDVGAVRAGGQVFQQFSWFTKDDDSCQVIFDLEFCSDVAYAVPSSREFKEDDARLRTLYDNKAKEYFQNFSNSLDQIACDTTSTAQYSLARTCTDCSRDYKTWLCSVLIPRCEDWSAEGDWLQERNINARFANGSFPYENNKTLEFNQTKRERFAFSRSRNQLIDDEIKPGPYKELKPCEDLCFDIVRSCPAQLGFGCPGSPARELSYGKRSDRNLTCNFPGAVVDLSPLKAGAASFAVRWITVVILSLLVAGLNWI